MNNAKIGLSKTHSTFNLDGYFEPSEYDKIYEMALLITGSHDTASGIADWCELAVIGEKYELPELTVYVLDDVKVQEINRQVSKGW